MRTCMGMHVSAYVSTARVTPGLSICILHKIVSRIAATGDQLKLKGLQLHILGLKHVLIGLSRIAATGRHGLNIGTVSCFADRSDRKRIGKFVKSFRGSQRPEMICKTSSSCCMWLGFADRSDRKPKWIIILSCRFSRIAATGKSVFRESQRSETH